MIVINGYDLHIATKILDLPPPPPYVSRESGLVTDDDAAVRRSRFTDADAAEMIYGLQHSYLTPFQA